MPRKKQTEEVVKEEVIEEEVEKKAKKKEHEQKITEEKQIKKEPMVQQLYVSADVPAVSFPDIRSNVCKILKAGTYYQYIGEIDNGKSGSFYEIVGKLYINKAYSNSIEII